MNVLDGVIIVAALAAAVGGWRFGFIARLLAWAGVALGLMIGIHFVPGVVTAFGGTAADDRVTVALLFLVLVATLGQGVGLGVSALVHRIHPDVRGLPVWDRAAGASLGALGVFTLVWMVIPSLATAEGWPARAARGSAIIGAIDRYAPAQPARFAAWGLAISQAPYPSALGPLDEPPDPGVPPSILLAPAVDARVRASIVKVVGVACNQIQEGSGWVAQPGIVVTNAHVVAGEPNGKTSVVDENNRKHDASVVAFDSKRDVALLSVPTLIADPLPEARGKVGQSGVVYGHPGGGELRPAPARIGREIVAVGTDIYLTSRSRRHVYVLAARLHPGDSGAPLVSANGDVVGVAFAIDPAHDGTAYAITDAELGPVLDAPRVAHASTGHCLAG